MNQFNELSEAPLERGWPLPAAVLIAVLDQLDCGLIICDGQGAMRLANRAAQAELSRASLLHQTADRVRGTAGCHSDLQSALTNAVIRGRQTLIRLEVGHQRLLVSVLPLSHATRPPMALLMLGRRRPCSELGLQLLSACYGLSLTEGRVLGGLVNGASPREIATSHEVQVCTVRTQISSIRSKLAAANIDELLLRAAEVPPVAGALWPAVSVHDERWELLRAAA